MGGRILRLLGLLLVVLTTTTTTITAHAAAAPPAEEEEGLRVHILPPTNLRRQLLTPPQDVYAVKLTNTLKVQVTASFTYSKGISNEILVEKKHVDPGASFTSGPYDYSDGSATFHYVIQAIKVKRVPPGADPLTQAETVSLTAPFEGVTGVTPLLEMDVEAPPDDATKEHIGTLTVKPPKAT